MGRATRQDQDKKGKVKTRALENHKDAAPAGLLHPLFQRRLKEMLESLEIGIFGRQGENGLVPELLVSLQLEALDFRSSCVGLRNFKKESIGAGA